MDQQLKAALAKIFKVFSFTYQHKWASVYSTPADISMGISLWSKYVKDYPPEVIEKAIDICPTRFEWPPSIGEFVKVCNELIYPSVEKIIQDAIRRDFSNPLTKLIFDRVGSWDFSNLSEEKLTSKVKDIYHDEISKAKKTGIDSSRRLESDKGNITSTFKGFVNRDTEVKGYTGSASQFWGPGHPGWEAMHNRRK